MALVFRQQITTNVSELYALNEAIGRFLFRPLRSDEKISPAEFLSLGTIKEAEHQVNYQVEPRSIERKETDAIHLYFSSPGGAGRVPLHPEQKSRSFPGCSAWQSAAAQPEFR